MIEYNRYLEYIQKDRSDDKIFIFSAEIYENYIKCVINNLMFLA